MESSSIALPAIQLVSTLVCNIVISPNSSVPYYTSTTDLAANQSSTLITMPVMRLVCDIVVSPNSIDLARSNLPSGYIVYPEINAAYKIFDEKVTWNVAKTRCARDNADLAEIDSEVKLQLVRKQKALTDRRHVGIYRKVEGSSTFYSVKTGLAVDSLPWGGSEPNGDSYLCVLMSSYANDRLVVYACDDKPGDYVCELPIPEHLKKSE